MNLPFVPSAIRRLDSPEFEVLQLFVSSEAPTHLNSDGEKKLREDEWLISAILREINQLKGTEGGAFPHIGRHANINIVRVRANLASRAGG
jgi:hypothetical protein